MAPIIDPIDDLDIRLVPGRWPLPDNLRSQVPAHWARLLAHNPALWDGQVLGVSGQGGGLPGVEGGVLRGEARVDAFSAFMTWRDQGFPECGIRNLFGSGLIVSADGALIYGRMGRATANAGRVYPPGGSLEPRDVLPDGQVDVWGSIALEMYEETGLTPDEAEVGASFAVFDGPRISVARVFRFAAGADVLLERIRATLATQEHRELDDVVAVRSGADALAAGEVPPYALALADAHARGELGGV